MAVRLRSDKNRRDDIEQQQQSSQEVTDTEKTRMNSWMPPRYWTLTMAFMILLAGGGLTRRHVTLVVAAQRSHSTTATTTTYKTIRAHVIHRHGDRSTITPLVNEDFWRRALVPKETADKIAMTTKIIAATESNTHAASGRGPFGKLTELGLLQMIKVGSTLRERFSSDQTHARLDGTTVSIDRLGEVLHPHDVDVFCTDFERTIQSVQGLLVGLFSEQDSFSTSSTTSSIITIDTRHTNWMIPDPQPRQTEEQTLLERALSTRPHILKREQELRPLAIRATMALKDLLAPDAHEISFGVDEIESGSQEVELQPLGWNQLAEITKCLSVREILPSGISAEDVEQISKHAAWRWFENLADKRLVYLAMNKMSRTIVEKLIKGQRLTIWSAHDSTLIGLLCAFRLQMPAVWPEYASSIVVELIEARDESDGKEHFVRFSLNGEQLNCEWEGEPVMDMIPMRLLAEKVGASEGGIASTPDTQTQ